MSNIGPNFRPPWQPPPSPGARPAGEANLPPASDGYAVPNGGMPTGSTPDVAQAALTPLFAFENALAPNQLIQLLRNLLQMPKEIVQLLATLADMDPAVGQELLKTLLTEDAPVSLEALQQLLQTHADKAQDKLLKLLQSGPVSMSGSGKQMGELMGNLSDMVSKAGKSPMEALHTAISLYLPGYPLHPPQAFTMRFEAPKPGEGEESGQSDEAQLVLWIETIRLGQFKVTIASGTSGQGPDSSQSPSRWQAWVEHDAAATSALPLLQEQITDAVGGNPSVSIACLQRTQPKSDSEAALNANAPVKTATPTEATTPEGRQSVGIHPAGGVSAGLLCLAYLFIRVIFELDNREGLTQQRAAAI